MRESDTVMSNLRLRRHRNLPVAPDVDPNGRIEMVAHLKIAEGGGHLTPRLHFYDDTRGPTRKIHIGYIGPHKHMAQQEHERTLPPSQPRDTHLLLLREERFSGRQLRR